jgi:hypothetical protein
MHGARKFLDPDPSDVETMRKTFSFNNLEDVDIKVMGFNDLPRENISHVTLVVYNTVDTESAYTLMITSKVSGTKLKGNLILAIAFLCMTGAAVIGLGVYAVIQYIQEQRYLRQLKYEAEAEILDDDDSFDEISDAPEAVVLPPEQQEVLRTI